MLGSGADRQHSLKGNESISANLVRDDDLVDHVTGNKVLKRPEEEAGMNPIHGAARANFWVQAHDELVWLLF